MLKKSFNRWPSWMWANQEIIELIDWLHAYNQTKQEKRLDFMALMYIAYGSQWKQSLTT